jgi:hypothetical protein
VLLEDENKPVTISKATPKVSNVKVPFGFEYLAKYSRVSIYSSSFYVWVSIGRVSKYWYRNTKYLNKTKSLNTLDISSKEDLNTQNRVYEYMSI